jgi:type I restriction enzyme M protein
MVGATMPTLQLASLKELSVSVPDELDAEKMRDAVDSEARLQAATEELKHEQAALSDEFWR